MNIKWIMVAVFLWVIFLLINLSLDATFTMTDSQSDLNIVAGFKIVSWVDLGLISLPAPNVDYFLALLRMMTLQANWMQDPDLQWLRWIMIVPIGVGLVLGTMQFFLSAVFGALKR